MAGSLPCRNRAWQLREGWARLSLTRAERPRCVCSAPLRKSAAVGKWRARRGAARTENLRNHCREIRAWIGGLAAVASYGRDDWIARELWQRVRNCTTKAGPAVKRVGSVIQPGDGYAAGTGRWLLAAGQFFNPPALCLRRRMGPRGASGPIGAFGDRPFRGGLTGVRCRPLPSAARNTSGEQVLWPVL